MENNKINGTIAAIDIKEDGTVYVQMEYNGQTIGDVSVNADNGSAQSKPDDPSINLSDATYKAIKSSQDSPSLVKVTPNYVSLIGSPNTRFVSSEKYGNFVVGPLSIMAMPQDIRIGGVFKMNPLLVSTMPSTIVTPLPMLIFDFPLADTAKFMSGLISEYSQFLIQATT